MYERGSIIPESSPVFSVAASPFWRSQLRQDALMDWRKAALARDQAWPDKTHRNSMDLWASSTKISGENHGWIGKIWFQLVGGWTLPPLKNMSSSIGMMTFPTEWNNKTCSKPTTSPSTNILEKKHEWGKDLKSSQIATNHHVTTHSYYSSWLWSTHFNG